MIDNYSRRILSWRVADSFQPAVTAELLSEADQDIAPRRRAAIGYTLGHAVVMSIIETHGDAAIRDILQRFRAGESFEDAFLHSTGERLSVFEARWRDEITPALPLLLYVVLENFELALLCFGAVVVAVGYLRWRLRRERSMTALGG